MIKVLLFLERVTLGIVKEFIEAYSRETALCYSLNRKLRNCNEKHNYFQHEFINPKIFRKMTIKLSDYYLYKISVGELICYPAFT